MVGGSSPWPTILGAHSPRVASFTNVKPDQTLCYQTSARPPTAYHAVNHDIIYHDYGNLHVYPMV